jgi:tetratricopeptide (TPR) repeat protein
MTTSPNPLALGKSLYRAGRLPEAETALRQAAQLEPGNGEAWWLLGVVSRALGRVSDAETAYRNALRMLPNTPELHVCLGNVYTDLRRFPEAAEAYEHALRLRRDCVEAYNGLGALYRAQERFEEAEQCFRDAVRLKPDFALGYSNLGETLAARGKHEDAIKQYEQALARDPKEVSALTNMGVAYSSLKKFDEAVSCHRKALAIQPDFSRAVINLGSALLLQGNRDEAERVCREAIRLTPNEPKAHFNLGTSLLEADAFLEAEASFRTAIRLDPTYLQPRRSLAILKRSLGLPHEAVTLFDEALKLSPDDPTCRMARSMLYLGLGRFQEGWAEYEWRWKCNPHDVKFPEPAWDGFPLEGKTILLFAEQGLGDTIQFARYAKLVRARGARVILQCQPELVPLLGSCEGIDQLVSRQVQPPPRDCHAMLLSVPGILGTDSRNIPADIPYLTASPELVERWRAELASLQGLKVGIAWQGNKSHPSDRYRSVELKQFEPLARVPGVSFVSLQKGAGTEQLAAWEGQTPILDLGERLDKDSGPFMDTAAVLRNLDLVITVDTALAHLAGALGVPVWVAVCADPDWRWQHGREDSPWYPTMRLFRQKRLRGWDDVFARMARVLELRLSPPRGPAKPVGVEIPAGELIDRITILRIKSERFTDPGKKQRVDEELASLNAVAERCLPDSDSLTALTDELRAVNERLWEIEDRIREREREGDFGEQFVELARSVYKNNDHRAVLKRRVNELVGSRLVEQKGYADHASGN